EVNWLEQALAVPRDSLYKYQWHYPQMQLPAAWDVTKGKESVIVAVVDTGIVQHADLGARVLAGFDMISDPAIAGDGDGRDDNPRDEGKDLPQGASSWHGTHVAGTIGALTDNNAGVAGVDWNCRIVPVRALGRGGGTGADIAAAMAWAVGVPVQGVKANASPAQVVNLSLGGDGPASQVYQDAIDEGNKRGAIFVIAAGNENENTSNKRPANQKNVLTVGAVGFTGSKASYSNFGAEVDVVAPGGEMAQDADGDGQPDGVLSTHADQKGATNFGYEQGTSMATPHVAGLVALMKSVNTALDHAKAEQILKETAVGAFKCSQGCGSGLVNATSGARTSSGGLTRSSIDAGNRASFNVAGDSSATYAISLP
ncbi:MAG: S8 family serine peptidase, partial [Myxococcales bacterium]